MIGVFSDGMQRYNKENNKHMKSYNQDKHSKYIIYKYANNLYGWVMSKWILIDLNG